MNIESTPTNRGWDWISEGFGLFRQDPGIWIVNLILFQAIVMLLPLIPIAGSIATWVLQPVLIGGLMIGCQAQARGEKLRVDHLFAGFQQNTKELMLTGVYPVLVGLLLVAVLGVGAWVLASFGQGDELLAWIELLRSPLGIMLALLIASAIAIPFAMAVWFAPALVVFANMDALDALQASFLGCLRNMLPFLLYGVAAFVLLVFALIPLGLGLLVLGPTLAASVYTAYRDIFK